MAAAQYYEEVQQAYLAYYGRPADPAGLAYWANQLNNAGGDLNSIINAFGTSAESTALYGGSNTAAQITAIYQTLFGRQPDVAGLNFYVNGIATGQFTLASVALNVYYGATGTDATALTAKLAYADAFTAALEASTSAQVAYTGTAASNNARAAVAVVVDTVSEAAAAANLSTMLTNIGAGTVGQSFTLTTGVDAITLTGNNNVVNGTLDGNPAGPTSTATLTALDSISGTGTGNVLKLADVSGGATLPAGISVSGVQTVDLSSAAGVGASAINAFNTASGFTGLQTLNVTQSTGSDYIQVGTGTAVSVVDSVAAGHAAGLVNITGGTTQTVTATNSAVTTSGATGNVAVTAADQDAGNNIQINDGANVNVTDSLTSTSAGGAETAGTITIGNTGAANPATHTPTGTVTVVENLNDTQGGGMSGNTIMVTGGTTDSITVNANPTYNSTAGANTTTIGSIVVDGTSATTSVSVIQTPAALAATAQTAVAAVKEVDTVTFTALTAGNSVTVGTLTFTASTNLTAAQVATAFANLANGATQGAGGPVTEGTYTGTALSGWTSGAVTAGTNSATVAFTSTTAAPSAVAGTPTLTATGTVAQTTNGVTAVTAVAGADAITDGTVTIADAATTGAGTISNVTLSGYGAGSTITSNALTTLSLANSSADVTVTSAKATTLALAIDNLGTPAVGATPAVPADVTLNGYATLNINTTGANSIVDLVDNSNTLTALTISGSKSVDLTGSTLLDLKTVTVSGSAGVTIDVSADSNLTDFNASATSGSNTVTIDASKATYEGGSGGDHVTLASSTVSNAVTLGSGNDTLVLATGTSAATITAAIDGGAGTNTLSMSVADAATDSTTTAFAAEVTNFQHLTLTGTAAAPDVVDLSKLGGYSYVTDASVSTAVDTLTFNNFASGGTLVLSNTTAGNDDIVHFTSATATNNALNVVLSNSAAIAGDTLKLFDAQTVNLTATDTNAKDAAGAITHTLTLADGSTTPSITTLHITGNANLHLVAAGDTAITTVDASGDTGGLTYTTAGTVAETVTGGAGVNVLTAAAGTVADTLIGGSGINTLTSNSGLDTLTGGSGQNTFVINAPASANTYATITNAVAGDTIKFVTAATAFDGTQVTLASTAVFQDYANQAVKTAATAGTVTWFQFGGNTYVVEAGAAHTSFTNGSDSVVELQGTVNLSHASFNSTTGSLVLH